MFLFFNILRLYPYRISSEALKNMMEPVQNDELSEKNVISVPSQCPAGYKPDALGVCREIFKANI